MAAFVKLPQKAGEVEEAAKYVKGYQRSSIGSYATWIEWGNVRFEQQFAEFIQDHHAYQFDYIGHLRQHWSHFSNTLKESWNDPEASVKDVLFSDNTMMNLFILFGVTLQLSGSALAALPSVLMAKWRHGDEWKEVVNLSALEKFQAKMQLDYSEFILYDPFFKYDYFKAIGEMWSAIYHSDDSFLTKCGDVVSAIPATLALTVQGLPSLFINHVYYAGEGESDEETIHVIIEDPQNRLQEVIEAWDEKKMETTYNERHPFEKCAIKEVYEAEGTKLISMPYYKPFMEITQLFGEKGITFKTVGGQKKVTLDLLLEKEAEEIAGARAIYTLDHLQDESKKYVTAEVDVENLSTFCGQEGVKGNIAHIHCHR